MFPQTTDLTSALQGENSAELGKSFLFDFSTGDFVVQDGKVVVADQQTAMRVWIEKILRTEKSRYSIYEGTQYGTSIEDLIIGNNYNIEFAESELRREVEEALTQHPLIIGVSNFSIERTTSGANIIFTVVLKDGTTFGNEVTF